MINGDVLNSLSRLGSSWQRANSSAFYHQVLKQRSSPYAVATDAAATVYEEFRMAVGDIFRSSRHSAFVWYIYRTTLLSWHFCCTELISASIWTDLLLRSQPSVGRFM